MLFINLFLLFTHDHSTNIYGFLSFILSFTNDHSTKIDGPLSFILSFTNDHSTEIYGCLSFILSLVDDHMTKIRVLINLFISFVHDYLTKIRVHSYPLIYSFLNCANISYAIFMAALPLYFLCCIHVQHYPYILHAIIHGYMKSLPQYYTLLNLSHRIYFVH